ncbi:MAG TPA: thioredoxin family protein [Thermoanaerobaculia bacterium]|nr:thioredoxin family protein [Thermoanaerobaculia bacterium]
MDRTETPAAPPPARPQSRLSPILLWVLAAAVLFRVVTALVDRGAEEGPGLVRWQPRERATALAQKSGKPILYEFSAAWCGPCKLLDRDWEDASVAARVNDGFVPAHIIDRIREDGQNPEDITELQRRFEISGFPALVAASPDGKLLGKLEGYPGRQRLLQFLENPQTSSE